MSPLPGEAGVVPMSELRFTVLGKPRPKGSLKPVRGRGSRHIRLIEDNESSSEWRGWVVSSAMRATSAHPGPAGEGWCALVGPVVVDVVFSFEKPVGAPKRRETWPVTRSNGDADKLLRNVLDALVDAGVMGDDSQVVDVFGRKRYCGQYPSALETPGAEIVVRPYSGGVN